VKRDVAARSSLYELATGAAKCAGAAALTISSAAAAVVGMGRADDVRRTLRWSFAGVAETPDEVFRIAFHNARIAAATFLCALAVARLPSRARMLVDALLATVFVLNATLIGVALGAYGGRLVASTGAHLPIEVGALALAGGAYLAARQRAVGLRSVICAAGLCAALLVLAAAAETYASGASQ
jgi:hypothetical protein